MITALRHLFVDSWLGRILALLTFFAFVVWGGNSIFNLSPALSGAGLVTVGKETISASDFEHLLETRLRVLSERMPEKAKLLYSQEGVEQVARQTLSAMEASLASAQVAQKAGFAVSDARIRERVFSNPLFQGKDGKFDPVKMNMILRENGRSREDLIKDVRQELYQDAVLTGLGDSVASSKAVAGYLSQYIGSKYKVEALKIPVRYELSKNLQPTEAQLKRFYLNHGALFRLPEYRHFNVAVLTKEGAAASIEVPEETLRRVYTERQHIYNVPQTRDVNVLTFSDKSAALGCKEKWHKNMTWDTFSSLCPEGIAASLEKARETDIPSSALGKEIFSAPQDILKGPVSADGQFSLALVGHIYPPVHRKFDEVRTEILKEIQASSLDDAYRQKLSAFQEAVAGVDDLKSLSKTPGIEIFSATIDSLGKTPAEREIVTPGGESLQKEIIQQVFHQVKGEPPHVINDDNKGEAFAVFVDEMSPERSQDFQEIKSDVAKRWHEMQSSRLTEIEATKLFQAAEKGKSLKQALAQTPVSGIERPTEYVLSRLKPVQGFPNSLANRVFSGDTRKAFMAEVNNAFWVIRIKEVLPMPAEEKEKMSSDFQKGGTASLQEDIMENLVKDYLNQYPVKNLDRKRYQEIVQHFVR